MLNKYKKIIKKYLNQKKILVKLPGRESKAISFIRANRLTYLSVQRLAGISTTIRVIEKSNLSGIFIEAGCALGGSSILISSLKKPDRPLLVYDVFGMIPPPTNKDPEDVHNRYKIISQGESSGIGGDEYYGYKRNLYEDVKNNIEKYGLNLEANSITLIQGLLQDTMEINQPVAFAHIDVDWYEPVMVSLERITPNLVVGGSIIIDDYNDWGGCKEATDAYFKSFSNNYMFDDNAGSLKITKVG